MSSTDDEENMYESQGNLFEENTDYDTLKLSDHCIVIKKTFASHKNLHLYCYKENISPSNVEII